MWVTKLLIFPVEIRIFCLKTTKFGPKLAFLVNLGRAMQALFGWAVRWWLGRAGCISQDTYLLYFIASKFIFNSEDNQANVTRIYTVNTLYIKQGILGQQSGVQGCK